MPMTKWVYAFGDGKSEGEAGMKNLLGGKGANLAEMSNLGLPVPPGFSITTEVCTHYYAHGQRYPDDLKDQVATALREIGEVSRGTLGDPERAALEAQAERRLRAEFAALGERCIDLDVDSSDVEFVSPLEEAWEAEEALRGRVAA